ncbi:DUF3040 domain-containing protein [Pseudonocardia kujensis]|uniref:DUF3040 domain-containing protein n=1 Tax=Pseudonocardia kujensis TaxID=1128675 RepID=UPI001E63E348|nr:DUF3040 domain-containing protein [Pseudonocardia kujensis]MCE0768700.1 DUF3040 domain-containing protein [Pseudonocardia kujensis]
MPLSEHEQRLLEQIERALYAEDPKFASTVRGSKLRKPSRRRRLQGIALFAVGLVLLVVGVAVAPLRDLVGAVPVVSVVGFLAMLGGTMLALSARGAGKSGGGTDGKQAEPDKNRFTGRMEERFRRRFEQD